MKINNLIFFMLFLCLFLSCEKEQEVERNCPRTVFLYFPWSTNLTDYFYNNIADLEKSIQENGLDHGRVVVFLSTSPSEAEMFEITLYDGLCRRTVLKEYVHPSFTTEAGLTEILGDMKYFAPAESYAMIIGCHGTGWLPVVQSRSKAKDGFMYHWNYENVPMTRFFGGLSAEYQTDISTLAQSLSNNGLTMEYILFDDCYMSSLEVAYELRHVTNYMIASPTEVMVFGMPYSTMGKYLLSETPDYKAICDSFYRFYSDYQYPYGTLAVTDCSYLDELAALMKQIHSNYSFDSTQVVHIQRMDGYSPVIFYDLGDYVRVLCGTGAEEYNCFITLLDKVVPHKIHTEEFYTASRGPVAVERFSGITTSEPSTNSKMVDYPQTSWYMDTY